MADCYAQEGKTNRVELKEDLVEVVEKMIEFFYTFNYNDKMPESSDGSKPLKTNGRPVIQSQMNAHVYALAEKYQIEELKALALEKFRETNPSSRALVLGATWTVYKDIELPNDDRALKDAVTEMWIVGSPDWWDTDGPGDVESFFREMPFFGAFIFRQFSKGFKGATVRLTCSKCNRKENVLRAKALDRDFKCKGCGETEPEGYATIQGHVQVQSFR